MRKYTCIACGFEKEDYGKYFRVVCPSCVELASRKMTNEQYKTWLILNRSRIWAGLKFVAWDDTTIGDKDTYASWGMCSDNIEAYPTPDYWEYGELTRPNTWDPNRIRVIERGKKHFCPFDRRLTNEGDPQFVKYNPNAGSGCFHECLIFKEQITSNDRAKAIARFDKAIEIINKEN